MFWTLYALLIVAILSIALASLGLLSPPPNVAPIAILVGALVALLTLSHNIRRARSQDHLDHAVRLLRRAYKTLAQQPESGWPKRDRVLWISAARHIESARIVGNRITDPSHKAVFNEESQYWRGRLGAIVLRTKEGPPEKYFADSMESATVWSDRRNRAPLDVPSVAVVYRFIRWPDNAPDPLDDVPYPGKEEIHHWKTFGPRGFGRFLEKLQEHDRSQNQSTPG